MNTALLLINTGSPQRADPAAVRSFLSEFFADPCVFRARWLRLLLRLLVLPRRSRRLAGHYRLIFQEGRSVQSRCCEELCRRLSTDNLSCRHAFLYAPPQLESELQELQAQGVERLLILPLYPQSSSTTCGSARRKLEAALKKLHFSPQLHWIEDYCRHEAYIEAIASSIREVPGWQESCIFCSYHSLPLSYLNDRADAAYIKACHDTTAALADKLQHSDLHCVFQSAMVPAAWQGPFLRAELRRRAGDSRQILVIFPGFAMDCLETSYEVDTALRAELKAAGGPADFICLSCLNASPRQSGLIARLVQDIWSSRSDELPKSPQKAEK